MFESFVEADPTQTINDQSFYKILKLTCPQFSRTKNKHTSLQQHLYLFGLFKMKFYSFFTSVFLIAKVNAKLDPKFEMTHYSVWPI